MYSIKVLYYSIANNFLHEDGLKATSEALDKRDNKEVPTDYIVRMMEILLNNNIFEFDEVYWKLNVGAAMGCKPVPPYANILMATIDTLIKILDSTKSLIFLKRFLDDYITFFRGSTKELHVLFAKSNQIHPTIKFTMNHTSIKN